MTCRNVLIFRNIKKLLLDSSVLDIGVFPYYKYRDYFF